MKKDVLIKFIQSYLIDKDVNSTAWEYDNTTNILRVKYQTQNKLVVGKSELLVDSEFGSNFEVGVYDSDKLLRAIKILDEDISIVVNTVNNNIPRSFTISDNKYKIVFMFSDLSIINRINAQVSDGNNDADYAVSIEVTPDFISDVLRATTAFADASNAYITNSATGVMIKIAESLEKSYNSVSINLEAETKSPVDMIMDTGLIKKIFGVHKYDTGVMSISNSGSRKYVKLTFVDDYGINSVYFLSNKSK